MYSAIVTTLCIPILLIKRLGTIGKINMIIMLMTLVSSGIVMYYAIIIGRNDYAQNMAQFKLAITEEDRQLKHWNLMAVPLLIAGCANLFEGNVTILTLYAEHNEPKNFIPIALGVQMFYVTIALTVGTLSYYAFGDTTQDIILLNLPTNESLLIAAKCLFFFAIVGSNVMFLQPLFYYAENSYLVTGLNGMCDSEPRLP